MGSSQDVSVVIHGHPQLGLAGEHRVGLPTSCDGAPDPGKPQLSRWGWAAREELCAWIFPPGPCTLLWLWAALLGKDASPSLPPPSGHFREHWGDGTGREGGLCTEGIIFLSVPHLSDVLTVRVEWKDQPLARGVTFPFRAVLTSPWQNHLLWSPTPLRLTL